MLGGLQLQGDVGARRLEPEQLVGRLDPVAPEGEAARPVDAVVAGGSADLVGPVGGLAPESGGLEVGAGDACLLGRAAVQRDGLGHVAGAVVMARDDGSGRTRSAEGPCQPRVGGAPGLRGQVSLDDLPDPVVEALDGVSPPEAARAEELEVGEPRERAGDLDVHRRCVQQGGEGRRAGGHRGDLEQATFVGLERLDASVDELGDTRRRVAPGRVTERGQEVWVAVGFGDGSPGDVRVQRSPDRVCEHGEGRTRPERLEVEGVDAAGRLGELAEERRARGGGP